MFYTLTVTSLFILLFFESLLLIFFLRAYRSGRKRIRDIQSELDEHDKEFNETAKVLVRRDMELAESNERLQGMDSAKSEFVSISAHQLRTPLAGLKWTLASLLDEEFGRLNPGQEKLASNAFIEVNRLIGLINDLLDVARLEEGRFGFNFKRELIIPILQFAYARAHEAAGEKGIHFFLTLPKVRGAVTEADGAKLSLAFDNLLENAIKYTLPGGSVFVDVSYTQDARFIKIEVRDTGIGIPREQFPRIFSKFFRAKNAQLEETSGTGLGLYLVKNIVEHHKGSISFESEEGKGSTFTVLLPLSR